MKFLLTAFKVYYVLEGTPIGDLGEEEQKKCDQDETLCKGYILSTLTDRLYDLYTPMTSTREIWNSLKEKYTAEKEGADKFITFKFFEFAMVDNVSILDQVHEFLILEEIDAHFKDFTLDQNQKHLRIKEETHIREKNLNGASSSKVNYVNSGKNNKGNDKKRKGTWNSSKDNKKDKKPLSEETEDGHEVMMGDNHTSKVISSGNVEIQFTSGKKLTLMNVLYVPNIRKNLVSGFKLCKSGVKAVIESDKNGIAERKNKVLQDMINDMLVSANVPKNLWVEALLTACHVSNRITAKKLKLSPYEVWNGLRGLKSIFVGYAKDSKSYRCLDLDSNVIVESRDAYFFKNKFRYDSTSTNETVTQISQDISGPNLNSNNKRNMTESSSAPRRSERDRKERNLDPDFIDSQAIIFLVEGDNEN
nr:reverse transcriptase, RNA-dependent DNA polymerase [Tanacetum cinerariifolium]